MTIVERTTEQSIQYWGAAQDALGVETVWSIWECQSVDQNLLKKKSYRISYTFIDGDATFDEVMNDSRWVTVTADTNGGTVRDLWEAAESCFQQAKARGDHHPYIENFVMQDDGSFELVMGS